jgi:16S rRNA (guanine(966)-N(2))-methyltransferase RsmD
MIFNMLENYAEDWSSVLDLYAGSGALGIEALSRGAERAVFVDKSPDACAAIKRNLAQLGFEESGTILRQTAESALQGLTGQFGIVFLDPPYADDGVDGVLRQIGESGLLSPDAVVVVEHRRSRRFDAGFRNLEAFRERRHGDTVVSLFRVKG